MSHENIPAADVKPAVITVPAEVLEAQRNRVVLMNWLSNLSSKTAEGCMLLSRPNDSFMWVQTGFLIEADTLYAKYGNHPYQPIGRVNGDIYAPTPGAKLLWANEFVWGRMEPADVPFKIVKMATPPPDDAADPSTLTDAERVVLDKAYCDIAEEVVALSKLETTTPAPKDGVEDSAILAAQERVLDTIKLASMSCKRLDKALTDLAKKNPEFKPDLTGLPVKQIARSCMEFLRMKLDDDGMRRQYHHTEIQVVGDASELNLVDGAMRRLSACLPVEGAQIDVDAAKSAIETVGVIFPSTAELVATYVGTNQFLEAVTASLVYLQKKRDELVGEAKPATNDTTAAVNTAESTEVVPEIA